jgi:hypothetical protein
MKKISSMLTAFGACALAFRDLSTGVIHTVGNLHCCSSATPALLRGPSWRFGHSERSCSPQLWITRVDVVVVMWTTLAPGGSERGEVAAIRGSGEDGTAGSEGSSLVDPEFQQLYAQC